MTDNNSSSNPSNSELDLSSIPAESKEESDPQIQREEEKISTASQEDS